ncbi:hypothetical protein [Paenisporosarcina sp.]|uniref:hypothetical protein n=1 Tax=Paenisporosarcina sp. TaxID=1932001 RepID=UPI003C789662
MRHQNELTEERVDNLSNSVVFAEKPSVARDIARVLGCHKKGNGFSSTLQLFY